MTVEQIAPDRGSVKHANPILTLTNGLFNKQLPFFAAREEQ
jgi:hypothetical protein